MLVQRRERDVRLIRQHDHALLSGELAARWRDGRTGAGLPWRLVLAVTLHDVVWMEEDERPRLDPETGGPYDFTSLPAAVKAPMVERGIARLKGLEPEVARLVESHHRTLAEASSSPPSPALAWLRLFDNLSLFLCLTAPGALPEGRPRWLGPGLLRPPGAPALDASWRNGELVLDPHPFGGDRLSLSVPHRDLPRRSYRSAEELGDAWEAAGEESWTVVVRPGSS